MPRPILAIIHPSALKHNLTRLQQCVTNSAIFAVVKANAYGHGIENVYSSLQAADGFALLDIAEAEQLRSFGYRGPILLLEGIFEPRDLEHCSRLNLWHVVHSSYQIDWLAAHKTHHPHRVFLKLNGGMQRLGFTPTEFASQYQRLRALPQVEEISLMAHFANADQNPNADHVQNVEETVAVFSRSCLDLSGERSLANSAAILRFGKEASIAVDWVRAGIALYGSSPDYPEHDINYWGLRPTMSLRSKIIAVQSLQAGDSIGYGSRYVASTTMRIGVVACGYADGYPRHAVTGTPVLVDGQKAPLIGRVSMDMLTIDISHLPAADVDSEVTLWGVASNGVMLPIDEVAASAATIAYELMCALAPRVRKLIED